MGYAYDASHNLAYRTNNTLLQRFTSNAKNELATALRAGTLTVSGNVTGAVATLGVNGTSAEIYSDGTWATTNGLTLNDGNNLFVTAGSNGAGTLVVSTKLATKLPATVNPVYDLNGNMVSDGLKGFEYDDANHESVDAQKEKKGSVLGIDHSLSFRQSHLHGAQVESGVSRSDLSCDESWGSA